MRGGRFKSRICASFMNCEYGLFAKCKNCTQHCTRCKMQTTTLSQSFSPKPVYNISDITLILNCTIHKQHDIRTNQKSSANQITQFRNKKKEIISDFFFFFLIPAVLLEANIIFSLVGKCLPYIILYFVHIQFPYTYIYWNVCKICPARYENTAV